LSPLLFVIVMVAFNKMIFVAVSGGLLSGFSLGTGNDGRIDISHLLFANDTLIFSGVVLDLLRLLHVLYLTF
jgi:hypothetical protein